MRYGYTFSELKGKMERAGFEKVDSRPHLGFFGVFGSDCIDTLKIFDTKKTHEGPFGYAAKHEWVYAADVPPVLRAGVASTNGFRSKVRTASVSPASNAPTRYGRLA